MKFLDSNKIAKNFNRIFLANPFISYEMDNFSSTCGILSEFNRAVPIIVSITSSKAEYTHLVKTIYSLLNQTLKPDKIILWLDEQSSSLIDLPYEITRFIKNGLEIRFVEYLKNYTPLYYALKTFPNAINVIASNEIYYPKNWLKKLYLSHIAYPDDVQTFIAYNVEFNKPLSKWNNTKTCVASDYNYLFEEKSGVLFPPKCFNSEVFRKDIFLNKFPDIADVWFWVMSSLNKRKVRIIRNGINPLIFNSFSLLFTNFIQRKNEQERRSNQAKELVNIYKHNLYNLSKSSR